MSIFRGPGRVLNGIVRGHEVRNAGVTMADCDELKRTLTAPAASKDPAAAGGLDSLKARMATADKNRKSPQPAPPHAVRVVDAGFGEFVS